MDIDKILEEDELTIKLNCRLDTNTALELEE